MEKGLASHSNEEVISSKVIKTKDEPKICEINGKIIHESDFVVFGKTIILVQGSNSFGVMKLEDVKRCRHLTGAEFRNNLQWFEHELQHHPNFTVFRDFNEVLQYFDSHVHESLINRTRGHFQKLFNAFST